MIVFVYLLLLLLAGCASGLSASSADKPSLSVTSSADRVRDLSGDQVGHCKFVGKVSGTSRLFSDSAGLARAKLDARAEAFQLGATHIIWTQTKFGLTSEVNGIAYICDP